MFEVDKSNMFRVLMDFHLQVKEAVNIASAKDVSDFNTGGIENIIINGLGGSAIGGDLIRSFTHYESKVPIYINRNYTLPAFATEKTLSIISSYSGNTEETNAAYTESLKRGCKIFCVTSGGKVEALAKENNNLYLKIPGGLQPRCAIGYSFFTLLITMTKLGFISDKSIDIQNAILNIEKDSHIYSDINNKENKAFELAKLFKNKLPVIYSSTDVLDVVNLRWRGQICENAKQLAYGNVYPEMNHNELVGWKINKDLLNKIVVVFLKDVSDLGRIKLRMDITKDIYDKYADSVINFYGKGDSRLERIFDLIYLGDWVSYHLAILNNEDPTPVEPIQYLKEKLEQVNV